MLDPLDPLLLVDCVVLRLALALSLLASAIFHVFVFDLALGNFGFSVGSAVPLLSSPWTFWLSTPTSEEGLKDHLTSRSGQVLTE